MNSFNQVLCDQNEISLDDLLEGRFVLVVVSKLSSPVTLRMTLLFGNLIITGF